MEVDVELDNNLEDDFGQPQNENGREIPVRGQQDSSIYTTNN